MSSRRRVLCSALVAALVAAGLVTLADPAPTAAAALPAGFREQVVFSGLNQPTNVEFAADGRVFVAEKAGRHQGFRQPRRSDADGLRRSVPKRAQRG